MSNNLLTYQRTVWSDVALCLVFGRRHFYVDRLKQKQNDQTAARWLCTASPLVVRNACSCERLDCKKLLWHLHIIIWPEIRPDYPLNLSILISGGKETNKDSLSSGERSGKSPAPNLSSSGERTVVLESVRIVVRRRLSPLDWGFSHSGC